MRIIVNNQSAIPDHKVLWYLAGMGDLDNLCHLWNLPNSASGGISTALVSSRRNSLTSISIYIIDKRQE